MLDKALKVLYIHGRRSSSQTGKCQFLKQHFDVYAADMPTKDFDADLNLQEKFVKEVQPDVIVGSSYGGAIAVTMLQKGTWKGPTILLAQAFARYQSYDPSKLWLPEGVAITFIHGTKDKIVEIEGSRLLSIKGTPQLVEMIEVSDEHELNSLIDNQMFLDSVREVYEKQKRYQE
ncbi:alpha/beta hydrolase [Rhizophagus clarus]|nr:alpha/beta hydrolase [Rhizophagus clarus]